MDEFRKLVFIMETESQDAQLYWEHSATATHDSRPSTSVGSHDNSQGRATKRPPHTRPDTDMNQGFSDPGSCRLSSGNPSTSGQEPRVGVPHKRFRAGFINRSSCQPFTCKSPSTDSTTSLLHLRDKLTDVHPLAFNKVTHRIATSPELPVLNELVKHEIVSNHLPKTKRFYSKKIGVPRKCNRDSEAQAQIINRTRCLSPVVEEHTGTLVLTAALGNPDVSVTNDLFRRFYKENPNFDVAALLVEAELHHAQTKDSEIISGKVTQDSDVKENTPVEKEVRHKQLSKKGNAKSIEKINESFDQVDITIDAADDRVTRALRTKSSTKTTHSHATNIDKEPLKTSVPKPQTSKKDQTFIKSSQETTKSSVKAPASEDRSDVNRSTASIEDTSLLQRNATPSSPRAADNDASREVLCQMVQTLQTSLAEIHEATSKRLIHENVKKSRLEAAFLKDQEELTRIEKNLKDISNSFVGIQGSIAELLTNNAELLTNIAEQKKNIAEQKKNRSCLARERLREVEENTARMVEFFVEDIRRHFD